jgi:hypothetical protein
MANARAALIGASVAILLGASISIVVWLNFSEEEHGERPTFPDVGRFEFRMRVPCHSDIYFKGAPPLCRRGDPHVVMDDGDAYFEYHAVMEKDLSNYRVTEHYGDRTRTRLVINGTSLHTYEQHGPSKYFCTSTAIDFEDDDISNIFGRNGVYVGTDGVRRHFLINTTVPDPIGYKVNQIWKRWEELYGNASDHDELPIIPEPYDEHPGNWVHLFDRDGVVDEVWVGGGKMMFDVAEELGAMAEPIEAPICDEHPDGTKALPLSPVAAMRGSLGKPLEVKVPNSTVAVSDHRRRLAVNDDCKPESDLADSKVRYETDFPTIGAQFLYCDYPLAPNQPGLPAMIRIQGEALLWGAEAGGSGATVKISSTGKGSFNKCWPLPQPPAPIPSTFYDTPFCSPDSHAPIDIARGWINEVSLEVAVTANGQVTLPCGLRCWWPRWYYFKCVTNWCSGSAEAKLSLTLAARSDYGAIGLATVVVAAIEVEVNLIIIKPKIKLWVAVEIDLFPRYLQQIGHFDRRRLADGPIEVESLNDLRGITKQLEGRRLATVSTGFAGSNAQLKPEEFPSDLDNEKDMLMRRVVEVCIDIAGIWELCIPGETEKAIIDDISVINLG